jgi:hypothetical protein
MTKTSKAEREEAIAKLRQWLKPGQTVYTVLESVSPSGMSRWIRIVLLETDDKGMPYATHPNHAVATALGLRQDRKHEGMRIDGCGMDMGFEIVYQLGATLWPDETPKPHGIRNGWPDRAGGYALKHRWL